MTSRLFASLTAFSIVSSGSIAAEEIVASEEVALEEIAPLPEQYMAAAAQDAKDAAASETVDKEPPKRLKPHYAGVRRPVEHVNIEKKKPTKVKSKWFSSKTHPKVDKKQVAEKTDDAVLLPDDRPHFIKTGNPETYGFLAQEDVPSEKPRRHSNAPTETMSEGQLYPQSGFQAPDGHFYLTADWLYWRTRQEGMEYATAKMVHFNYQSGFRLGMGVHLPHNGWDIFLNYTNFYPDQSDSAHGSLYPLFLIAAENVSQAHAHWHIGFQSLDIEIGRAYHIAKTLIFRPFIGMKGAWIDQHAKFHYQGGFIPAGQTYSTHFENDFKGAGPLIGIGSNWVLGAGFSLFGDIGAALMAGHFDNEQKQYKPEGTQVVDLNTDFNLVSPTAQMVIGLAWDRNFNHDRSHFGLSVGFDTQYWWGQNQTEQFVDDVQAIYVRQNGDLAFYGLTLSGRFDF